MLHHDYGIYIKLTFINISRKMFVSSGNRQSDCGVITCYQVVGVRKQQSIPKIFNKTVHVRKL